MKLNLETMRSSVTRLDTTTGRIEKQLLVPEPWQRMSLRHMSSLPRGRTLLAGQWQGPADMTAPLLWVASRNQDALVTFAANAVDEAAMRGYVGNVASDQSGQFVVTTAPRGNVTLAWNTETGQLLEKSDMEDVSGIAGTGIVGGFLATQGNGQLSKIYPSTDRDALRPLLLSADRYWENHISTRY